MNEIQLRHKKASSPFLLLNEDHLMAQTVLNNQTALEMDTEHTPKANGHLTRIKVRFL